MKWNCRMLLILLIFMVLMILEKKQTYALELPKSESLDFNYEEIQDVVDDILGENSNFDFGKYVKNIFAGNEKITFKNILEDIKNGVVEEIKNNIGILTSLITIALIAAVISNLSHAFKSNQATDTGFYITYLLMFSIIIGSFIVISDIARETIHSVLEFMKVLVPTYYMAVAFSTSASTSTVYYQGTLFLITIVDLLLVRLVIPLINMYLIIIMANNISKEDLLSKLGDLILQIVKWTLKTLLALVIGFNSLQGLVLPVADKLQKNLLLKTAGAIPGVGDLIGGIAENVIGAGVLLKNVIGVAGVIVVIIICAVPLIKIAITSIIYRLCAASVQPISDKRMIHCISGAAEATSLLFQTLLVSSILFLFTITIVAASTTR